MTTSHPHSVAPRDLRSDAAGSVDVNFGAGGDVRVELEHPKARETRAPSPAGETKAPSPAGETKALRDEIVEELRERIISGRLHPGERLRERALSEEFGVSRVPVREAILVLEQQRLLTTEPRVGATVTDLTARDVTELFDLRLALEPLTAQLAAKHRTADDLARLEASHQRAVLAAGAGDHVAGSLANADFHLDMLRAAHSDLLWQVAGPLHPQIMRLFRQTIASREASLCDDHDQVLAAVRRGDEELAGFWARRHVTSTREASIALFQQRTAAPASQAWYTIAP